MDTHSLAIKCAGKYECMAWTSCIADAAAPCHSVAAKSDYASTTEKELQISRKVFVLGQCSLIV